MNRTSAREIAFKTIYAKFFNAEESVAEIDQLDSQSVKFISEILNTFADHYEEINEVISSNLKGYTLSRLFKIDLAIITLAVIELKFINKTPKEVIINEAIELAKKYSTEKSPRFINGLLADIVK